MSLCVLLATAPFASALQQQTAPFAERLWGVGTFAPVKPADPSRVKCTVYEIGGRLTDVLSTTCSKDLPLIPHVGVEVYGREYFYSDVIESREKSAMAEMLGEFPQIVFDLGQAKMTREELESWIDDQRSDWQPESYNVFDHNCNHFARLMMDHVATRPLDAELMDPVIAVTEEMLSELPDWRRSLGLSLMNQVTRLVVVSWGRATKAKQKAAAS